MRDRPLPEPPTMGTITAVAVNGPIQHPLSPYESLVRSLSDRLVEAQRPIRVLDAIKWDDNIERAFFAANAIEQPPVTRDYYRRRPLPFDPDSKRQELRALERDVRRQLGMYNAAGALLARSCDEFRQVVDLIELRGTAGFGAVSERLYGGTNDRF